MNNTKEIISITEDRLHDEHQLEIFKHSAIEFSIAICLTVFAYIISGPIEKWLNLKDYSEFVKNSVKFTPIFVVIAIYFLRCAFRCIKRIFETAEKFRIFYVSIMTKFDKLEAKFNIIASTDNIITPSNGEYKLLSVANIEKVPTDFFTDWHLGPASTPDKSKYKPKSINGYLLLFWPTIDDMINSQKYVEYLFSNRGEKVSRILFTPTPRYMQGLEIYRSLCAKAGEKLYVIDAEIWNAWLVNSSKEMNEGNDAAREVRKGLLDLIERHVEIWVEGTIEDIATTMLGKRWLVRWLGDRDSDEDFDIRSSLADAERRLERKTSANTLTTFEREKFKRVAGFIQIATSVLGEATDKKSYPDVKDLLGRGIPEELTKFVLDAGHA